MAEAGARELLAQARWFLRGVTGADAYERYLGHLRRVHPDAAVPTRAEFWRQRHADQERNPGSRCC